MSEVVLYDFPNSSAAYRVRIALNLKGIAYRSQLVDFQAQEHRSEAYLALNPQGFVPALSIGGELLTQSLAIIEYLDAIYPAPALLPTGPLERARVQAKALVVAADIHPLNNLRVRRYLAEELGLGQDGVRSWINRWIAEGFAALEAQAPAHGLFGGDTPNLVDLCLVPQMYNAVRFKQNLVPYPRLTRIDAALQAIPAFAAATPEAVQPQ